MRQLSIPSIVIVLLVCGAVASAGVVGTYAIIAPLVTGETPETSQVRIFVDDYLPVKLRRNAGGILEMATQGSLNFVRNGASVQQVNVGGSGTTQVSNLGYGPYSIFISGADGFAAFGTWIAPATGGLGVPGTGIDVALIPGSDMGIVRQIIDDHLHLGGPSVVEHESEPTPIDSPEHPRQNFVDADEELNGNIDGEEFVADATANRDLIQGHGFEIREDGSVVGKIARSAPPSEPEPPLPGLDVYFIQAGRIVAEGRTDFDGIFRVSGLSAGVYSLVVAGSDAFVALATEVHPPLPFPADAFPAGGAPVAPSITQIQFGDRPNSDLELKEVSLLAKQLTVATVSPVFSSDLGFLGSGFNGEPGDQEFAETPFGEIPFGPGPGGGGGFGSGSGGGFGGGGGGPSGGGGLGALLGLGALGLAAVALADSGGDGAPVVSPAIP